MDKNSNTVLVESYKNKLWGFFTDGIRTPNPLQFQLIPLLFGPKYIVEFHPNAPISRYENAMIPQAHAHAERERERERDLLLKL